MAGLGLWLALGLTGLGVGLPEVGLGVGLGLIGLGEALDDTRLRTKLPVAQPRRTGAGYQAWVMHIKDRTDWTLVLQMREVLLVPWELADMWKLYVVPNKKNEAKKEQQSKVAKTYQPCRMEKRAEQMTTELAAQWA